MATVRELLHGARDLPGDSARRDAEVLLGHCLQRSRSWLYAWPERDVDLPAAQRFEQLLERRRGGYPVAYLVGEREFWSLSLAVTEATLIPRPETETLVAWALALALPATARILDLGTGTGAIALALASERPDWRVCALDASGGALAVARANATALGLSRVEFLQSDWYAALGERQFDLIVANPPYVAADDPHLARGDLRFEPRGALVGGVDGFADLEVLLAGAPARLATGGWLLLEHGADQGPVLRRRFAEHGFPGVETRCDVAGLERVTGGCRAH